MISGQVGAQSDGIEIGGSGADNNLIYGNYIGTNFDGTLAIGNARHGVVIYNGVQGTKVGGTGTGEGNIISGNTVHGVVIDGNGISTTTANVVQGNLIGLNAAGAATLGNGDSGVRILGGAGVNTIGGITAAARNVISGNVDGIYIQDADGITIQGNYIGTDVTGLLDRGNSDRGVQLESGANNTFIGGTTAAARNVISGNDNDGIIISDGASPGTGTTGTVIQGNFVGVGADGTTAVGNGTNGVRITTESGHTIGGTVAGAGNVIAHNGKDGVMIQDSAANMNSILGNVIHANAEEGIDLGNNGVTGNDVGDPDSGSNSLQNYPLLASALSDGSSTITIDGSINTTAGTAYRIEFFASTTADVSDYGEAERFLGATDVTTDGSGNATFSVPLSAAVGFGEFITATATVDLGAGNYGDTSEFAQNVKATLTNNPPMVSLTNTTTTLAEDTDTSTAVKVADILVMDDALGANVLSLVGTDAANFEIVGNELRLKAATTLDFETQNSYAVTVQVDDTSVGGMPDDTANCTLSITNVNEAPSDVSLDNATVAENAAGVVIGSVTVTDEDAGDSHTWSVSDARFEIVAGQLRLKAGQALDYETEPTVNITLTATDTGGLSYNELFAIAVTDVNEAPSHIALDNVTVAENAAGVVIGNVTVTDEDAGDSHTWLVSDARFEIVAGQLRLKAGQALDHEPEPTVNVTLTATDAGGLSYNELFAITVTDVNEAPSDIALDNATAAENAAGAVIGSVTVTDEDAGDSHTWSVSDARFEIVAGQLRLKAGQALDYETEPTVSITLTATDTGGLSYNELFAITVTDANEAPSDIALNNVTVAENAAGVVIGNVAVTDEDAGDSHTWSVSDARFEVVAGQLRLKAGQALDHESEPTVDVTLTATDAGGLSYSEPFAITVTDVNDHAPAAIDDAYAVDEAGTLTIAAPGVAANDSDADGDVLTFSVVSGPANGTLTLNTDGSFTYTHDGGETPSDSFTYQVDDGFGGVDNAVVSLTVNPINDAPAAAGDSYVVIQGAALDVTAATGVLFNDTDAEGDPLSVSVLTGPTNGTLSLNADGSFIYTHDNSLTVNDSFTYQVADGNGGIGTAAVNFTITMTNTAPVAAGESYNVDEGATLTVAAPGLIANDADSDGDPLTATLLTGPDNGTLTLNTDGSFTYNHDGSETASDSFAYQVADGNGGSAVATVMLAINPVNDVPTVSSSGPLATLESVPLVFSTANGTALNVDDMDAQGNPVMVTLSASNGVFTLAQTSGLTFGVGDGMDDPAMTIVGTLDDIRAAWDGLEYRPQANFIGAATIQITIDDQGHVGSGGPRTASTSVVVDVTPDNAPRTRGDNLGVPFGEPASGNVLTNDTDAEGDPLTATLVQSPAHGTLLFHADGSFTYTPHRGFVGVDSFTYLASDGVSMSQEADVSISVGFAAASVPSAPPTRNDGTADDEDLEPATTILPPMTATIAEDLGAPIIVSASYGRNRDDAQSAVVTEVRDAGSVTLADLDPNISAGSFTRSFYFAGGIDVEILSPELPVTATPATFSTAWLCQQMSEIAAQLESDSCTVTLGQIAFTTTATALSVGYVIWSIRSGYLLASMMTAMPAWQRVDPLPVLDFVRAKQNKHRRRQETGRTGKSLLESILGE